MDVLILFLADQLGIPTLLIIIVLAVLALLYLILKRIAPKTETKWDDSIIDMIEGLADTLGVDPDELAKKSIGRLKQKIVKK